MTAALAPSPEPGGHGAEEEAEQAEFMWARRFADVVITAEADVSWFRLVEHAAEMGKLDTVREAELNRLVAPRPCLNCGARFTPQDSSAEGDVPLVLCSDCGSRKRQAKLEQAGWTELLERYAARAARPPASPPMVAEPPAPSAELEQATEPEEDLDEVLDGLAYHFEPMSQPQPEEKPVSTAERSCPHCDKKLRSDNTRGVCSKCWLKHERYQGRKTVPRERAAAKEARAEPTKSNGPEPSDASPAPDRRNERGDAGTIHQAELVRSSDRVTTPADVEARFNVVVDVLGLNRDAVLRELMAGWLASIKAKLRPGPAP